MHVKVVRTPQIYETEFQTEEELTLKAFDDRGTDSRPHICKTIVLTSLHVGR